MAWSKQPDERTQWSNESPLNFKTFHCFVFFLSLNTKMLFEMSKWIKTPCFSRPVASLLSCSGSNWMIGQLQMEGGTTLRAKEQTPWFGPTSGSFSCRCSFSHPVDSLQPRTVFHHRPLELLKHPSADALSHFYFLYFFFLPALQLEEAVRSQSSQNTQRVKRFQLSTCFCGPVVKKKKTCVFIRFQACAKTFVALICRHVTIYWLVHYHHWYIRTLESCI